MSNWITIGLGRISMLTILQAREVNSMKKVPYTFIFPEQENSRCET